MITLICDSSAETHLITNIKAFTLRSLTVSPDLSGDNRIKVELIVSKSDMTKVVGYLREHYVKQYNGYMIFVTDYIPV
jgi:hypothetical protein